MRLFHSFLDGSESDGFMRVLRIFCVLIVANKLTLALLFLN
nr:MAG TPA: hypothetical protein [Caudoviricetes sp.]